MDPHIIAQALQLSKYFNTHNNYDLSKYDKHYTKDFPPPIPEKGWKKLCYKCDTPITMRIV